MLAVGKSRRKNVKSTIFSNMANTVVTGLVFWTFGYAVAYGCHGDCHPFIGVDNFGLSGLSEEVHTADFPVHGYLTWFHKYTLAAVCTTIGSGAMLERSTIYFHMLSSLLVSGFLHPVVAHWLWSDGWLSKMGAIDTAGGGAVFIVGGLVGLLGAVTLGPRSGRFEGARWHVRTVQFLPFSMVFHTLGVMVIWTGWYGFTCSSFTEFINQEDAIGKAVIDVSLSAASAAFTSVLTVYFASRRKLISTEAIINGAIAGLVSVSSGAGIYSPGISIVIGVVGSAVFLSSELLLSQLLIDDPTSAVSVHFFCGMWSLVAVGLFASDKGVRQALPHRDTSFIGVAFGGDGKLLGMQLLAVVATVAICVGVAGPAFFVFHKLGYARVGKESEMYGLDSNHRENETRDRNVLQEKMAGRALGQSPTNVSRHLPTRPTGDTESSIASGSPSNSLYPSLTTQGSGTGTQKIIELVAQNSRK